MLFSIVAGGWWNHWHLGLLSKMGRHLSRRISRGSGELFWALGTIYRKKEGKATVRGDYWRNWKNSILRHLWILRYGQKRFIVGDEMRHFEGGVDWSKEYLEHSGSVKCRVSRIDSFFYVSRAEHKRMDADGEGTLDNWIGRWKMKNEASVPKWGRMETELQRWRGSDKNRKPLKADGLIRRNKEAGLPLPW